MWYCEKSFQDVRLCFNLAVNSIIKYPTPHKQVHWLFDLSGSLWLCHTSPWLYWQMLMAPCVCIVVLICLVSLLISLPTYKASNSPWPRKSVLSYHAFYSVYVLHKHLHYQSLHPFSEYTLSTSIKYIPIAYEETCRISWFVQWAYETENEIG